MANTLVDLAAHLDSVVGAVNGMGESINAHLDQMSSRLEKLAKRPSGSGGEPRSYRQRQPQSLLEKVGRALGKIYGFHAKPTQEEEDDSGAAPESKGLASKMTQVSPQGKTRLGSQLKTMLQKRPTTKLMNEPSKPIIPGGTTATPQVGEAAAAEGAGLEGGAIGALSGVAGAAFGTVAALAGLTKGAIDTVKSVDNWTKTMHGANMQFAQFSGAMAAVQAGQQSRDIITQQARGNQLAPGAEEFAQAKTRWDRGFGGSVLAGWQNFQNKVGSKALDAGNSVLENVLGTKDVEKSQRKLHEKLRKRILEEGGEDIGEFKSPFDDTQVHDMFEAISKDWDEKHGRPDRFNR